jgi:UDPglucose--hexose-1-phosphate uridylyltransferase
VLRNNITTEEAPWGVYHPSADLHHIKKENIGLIEVMGLAILPARLKKEMALLEEAILTGKNLRDHEETEKHADWAEQWIPSYPELNKDNIHSIVQEEIGHVFTKVLECAGVYKRNPEGKKGFLRFVETL